MSFFYFFFALNYKLEHGFHFVQQIFLGLKNWAEGTEGCKLKVWLILQSDHKETKSAPAKNEDCLCHLNMIKITEETY